MCIRDSKYVAHKAAEYLEEPIERLKLITCHLGNGSAIAAVDQGKVVDTSMGMTPLAGLMMGTRCGDLDPSVAVSYTHLDVYKRQAHRKHGHVDDEQHTGHRQSQCTVDAQCDAGGTAGDQA